MCVDIMSLHFHKESNPRGGIIVNYYSQCYFIHSVIERYSEKF